MDDKTLGDTKISYWDEDDAVTSLIGHLNLYRSNKDSRKVTWGLEQALARMKDILDRTE